jgi:colanic acid biosynthesis glycosyl transferase WcaI
MSEAGAKAVGKLVSTPLRSVVFADQFYFPDGYGGTQIPRDITMHLARNGFAVDVICGKAPHSPDEGHFAEDPTTAGVNIRRTPSLLSGDVKRHYLLRQLWFCLAALPLLLFRRAPSLFLTQTSPPLLVPAMAFLAALRRRPFVIISQDLYPEVIVAHGMVGARSVPARILGSLFRWAYRRAARVVSLGPVMTQRLVQKGVLASRITEISNWATGDEGIVRGRENRLRKEWGLEGCFVIMYSGNLGVAHDVETPIFAVRGLMAEMPTLRLVFVGKGVRLVEAQRLARDAGVSGVVQFRPLVASDMLPHSLGIADLALVTMRTGFEGLVVPSKLLGYMARGIPTLYVGPPSDSQQLIDESGGGLCTANGDVDRLIEALRRLAGDPELLAQMSAGAERYYRERVSRQIGLERYRAMIEEVAGVSMANEERLPN